MTSPQPSVFTHPPSSDATLAEKILAAHSGILIFGMTPPRTQTPPDKVRALAQATLERLSVVNVDGLILYDLDDESDRNPSERPFPYLATIDPAVFRSEYLAEWQKSVVVYRCVGKYPAQELEQWLHKAEQDTLTVFVGSSSSGKNVHTSLAQAQQLREDAKPDMPLGGVVITERHRAKGDEHLRMIAKQERGVQFFVSQVIYNVDATKNLLSDYYYTCRAQGVSLKPIIFTMSVCGSLKTMEFLEWLGVDLPNWFKNDLRHAQDPLGESYAQCLSNANELVSFCTRLGIPFGFNIESVSIRKVEIEATVSLVQQISTLLSHRVM